MNSTQKYYLRISEILAEVFRSEEKAIEDAAKVIAEANMRKSSVFAFGCNHAGLITLELFYRTGGMVTVNPVRAPGMMLDVSSITMSSELERIPGYGTVIFNGLPAKKGDVIIIHSVSGRNAVTVDMAKAASEKGLTVIVVTNMNTAQAVTSRHPSGKKLYEFVTHTVDNCAPAAEAMMDVDGIEAKFAAASGIASDFLLWSITAVSVEKMLEKGFTPGVYKSHNFPGGPEYNEEITKHFEKFGW